VRKRQWPRFDTATAQGSHDPVASFAVGAFRQQRAHGLVVRDSTVWAPLPGQFREACAVSLRQLSSAFSHFSKTSDLHDPDRCTDVAHAEVARSLAEYASGVTAVIAQEPQFSGECGIVCEAHPSLAGRDEFARMKTQAGHDTKTPAWACVIEFASERACCVFNDRYVRDRTRYLVTSHRISKLIDHNGGSCKFGPGCSKGCAPCIPLVGVNIEEDRYRAAELRGMRRAWPR